MSREIRFRVWSEKCGIFLADIVLSPLSFTKRILDSGCYRSGTGHDRLVLEEYTGLDDKNGQAIFEGDIIQEIIDVDNTTDGTYRYEVYWDEDTLCWSIKGISDIDYHLRDDLWETNASREVIGNIHEPPKDFRPEHLKRMGVSISKGGEE